MIWKPKDEKKPRLGQVDLVWLDLTHLGILRHRLNSVKRAWNSFGMLAKYMEINLGEILKIQGMRWTSEDQY